MANDLGTDLLNQLVADSQVQWAPPPQPVQKLRYTHDAMIDLIIANPAISQNELAHRFGYSPSWISTVIASDTFQARYAERRKELIDPSILDAVEQQFQGLVRRSMEVLMEKLNKPADAISDQLALRALEVSTRAAGYGAKAEPASVTTVQVNNHLEFHGDQLVALLRRKKAEITSEVLDHDPSKDLTT